MKVGNIKKKLLLVLPVLLLFLGNVLLNAQGDTSSSRESTAELNEAREPTSESEKTPLPEKAAVDEETLDKETEPSPAPSAAPSPTATPVPTPTVPPLTVEEQLGQDIADFALGFWGSNYKYGEESPEKGFDCSGLVFYVYGQFGYKLERVAAQQAKQGIEVAKEDIRPGDVLCFFYPGQKVNHIGIYVGQGYYIHAMGQEYGVVVTPIDQPELKRDYIVRRYIGCEELMLPEGAPAPTA